MVAVLGLQLLLFPVPLGVWMQGVVLGLLGSLMAVGLGLTYRMNGVINFAQGDLGTAPAVLAVGLVGLSGVDYFLGLATGLVAAVLLTAAVEIVVVRRFRRSPRLILTVATIGLSQFLVVVSLLIPRIWGQTPISTAVVNFPWHATWHVEPVVFTADDLIAVLVSVGCLAAVSIWFTRSDVGIAVRATGDRRDRASMLGIPVGRLQSITWVAAGVLSFVSIFFQAAIVGMPLDPTYGLTALVTALAALALGNFSDLRAIAAAAVALGVLEQGVAWDDPTNPTLGLAVLAGVVFAAILVRQVVERRTDREAEASLTLAGSVRDLSPESRRLPEVRAGIPLGTAAAFAAACTLPLWLGPGALVDASTLVTLAIVGCSVVVLTGWSGQVSLGQMSFAAVGAVIGAVALLDWHWDLSLALLLAGAATAAVAVVVGIPTLRLDGMFAAVTTLAFAPGRLRLPARPGRVLVDPAGHTRRALPLRDLHHVAKLRVRALPRCPRPCARRNARPTAQPHRTGAARPARQPACRLGLWGERDQGEARRVRRVRFRRRARRLPLPRRQPAVRGGTVPRAGEPGGVHVDRGGRPELGLGRSARRGARRGQHHLPATELAALPLCHRRDHRAHRVPRGLAGLCYDLRDQAVAALARRHAAGTSTPAAGPAAAT